MTTNDKRSAEDAIIRARKSLFPGERRQWIADYVKWHARETRAPGLWGPPPAPPDTFQPSPTLEAARQRQIDDVLKQAGYQEAAAPPAQPPAQPPAPKPTPAGDWPAQRQQIIDDIKSFLPPAPRARQIAEQDYDDENDS